MFRVLSTAVSGLFCVGAGIYLLTSQSVGADSYIELIAHGMGAYFIGKGLFVWVSLAQQHDQLELLRAARATEILDRELAETRETTTAGSPDERISRDG